MATPRKPPDQHKPRGRPTDYHAKLAERATALCMLGATDEQVAASLEIAVSTLNLWKTKHPEFMEALKAGRDKADSDVARSLFQRAMGYSHKAVKIHVNSDGKITKVPYTEHYPPDTTALIFWLKNRQRANWRDKQEVEHSGGLTLEQILTESQKLREPKE